MKIAITVSGNNVSTSFGKAGSIMIAEFDENKISSKIMIDIKTLCQKDRINTLINQNVKGIICNGIEKSTYHDFINSGVNVMQYITGNVDQVVKRYIDGNLYFFYG